eukprot:3009830-Rhodomonas_salina.1
MVDSNSNSRTLPATRYSLSPNFRTGFGRKVKFSLQAVVPNAETHRAASEAGSQSGNIETGFPIPV